MPRPAPAAIVVSPPPAPVPVAEDALVPEGEAPDDAAPAEGDAPAAEATRAADTPAAPVVDEFTPLTEVPEPLRPHARRMQADYTKKTQQLAELRRSLEPVKESAAVVQRFWQDPEYAETILRQRAQQLGYTLARPGAGQPTPNGPGTPPPGAPSSADSPPPAFVQELEASLSPELRWMAPAMAPALWKGVAHLLHPVLQKDQARDQEQTAATESAITEALSQSFPGWEAYAADMQALDAFLQSGKPTHPRFGSRKACLYRLAAGPGAAASEATRRMAEAAKARTTTGTAARTTVPNIADRVRKAKTTSEAMQIAAAHAVETLKASGQLPAEE